MNDRRSRVYFVLAAALVAPFLVFASAYLWWVTLCLLVRLFGPLA